MPLPTEWAGLAVVPMVHVKGVYIQKMMAGLVMEVTSLMVGDVTSKENAVAGFI